VATRFFARFLFTTAAATFIASQARPAHRLTTGHCHTWPEIGCDTLHVAKHLHKLPAKSPLPIAHGAIFDFRFFPLILVRRWVCACFSSFPLYFLFLSAERAFQLPFLAGHVVYVFID